MEVPVWLTSPCGRSRRLQPLDQNPIRRSTRAKPRISLLRNETRRKICRRGIRSLGQSPKKRREALLEAGVRYF
jgi:hypothetical protein